MSETNTVSQRIWEALSAGSIPLIEKCERGGWDPLLMNGWEPLTDDTELAEVTTSSEVDNSESVIAVNASLLTTKKRVTKYGFEPTGKKPPLLFVENWRTQIETVMHKLDSRRVMEALQKKTYTWWVDYVDRMQSMVAHLIH